MRRTCYLEPGEFGTKITLKNENKMKFFIAAPCPLHYSWAVRRRYLTLSWHNGFYYSLRSLPCFGPQSRWSPRLSVWEGLNSPKTRPNVKLFFTFAVFAIILVRLVSWFLFTPTLFQAFVTCGTVPFHTPCGPGSTVVEGSLHAPGAAGKIERVPAEWEFDFSIGWAFLRIIQISSLTILFIQTSARTPTS